MTRQLFLFSFVYFFLSCAPQSSPSEASEKENTNVESPEQTQTISDTKDEVKLSIDSGDAKGTSVNMPAGTLAVGSILEVKTTDLPDEFTTSNLTVVSPAIAVEAKDKDGKSINTLSTPMTIVIPFSKTSLNLADVEKSAENLCVLLKSADDFYVWRYQELDVNENKNLVSLDSKYLGIFTVVYCGQEKLAGFSEVTKTENPVQKPSTTTTTASTDNTQPAIKSIAVPASKIYLKGELISFNVKFSEAVTVSGGTPYLTLNAESNLINAFYMSGSGTDTVNFQSQPIASGINDLNGLILQNTLSGNQLIKDAAGLLAPSTFTPPSFAGIKISTPWMLQLGETTFVNNVTTPNQAGDYCEGVATDSVGHIYCAGYTAGNMGSVNAGGQDLFIAKFSPQGTLLWVYQHGNNEQQGCKSIAVDPNDNVYCAGFTEGDLESAHGNDSTNDAFILKLNANGSVAWLKQYGIDVYHDKCLSVAVDDTYVYCSGYKNGLSLDMGKPWIMKASQSTGDLVWERTITAGIGNCNGVTVDNSGNVYCGGSTAGEISNENQGGSDDVVVVKVTSDNSTATVKQFGGTSKANPSASTPNSGSDICYDIKWSASGYLYCSGSTTGEFVESNGGGNDAFIIKLNPADLSFVSGIQLGATTKIANLSSSNANNEYCYALAVKNTTAGDELYCAGHTDGNTGEVHGDLGNSTDIFVWKVKANDEIAWVKQFGSVTSAQGNSSNEYAFGLGLDQFGNVFVGGYTDGDFGETNASTSNHDVILIKLDSNGSF